MALYTYQLVSESGSFGQADSTDVAYATSKKDLVWAFDNWRDEHEQVGSSADYASVVVWRGKLLDVQGQYPDFVVTAGPRGGARFESC